MGTLIEDLIAIMDDECKDCEEWKKNKPIIINIYMGDDEE